MHYGFVISDLLCAYLCKRNGTGKAKLLALLAELEWNHKQHAIHIASATVTLNSNDDLLMITHMSHVISSTLLIKHLSITTLKGQCFAFVLL